VGKHLLSHRYNLLPLLRSRPGGVQRELIVKDLPATKVAKDISLQKEMLYLFLLFGRFLHNPLTLNVLNLIKNLHIFNMLSR